MRYDRFVNLHNHTTFSTFDGCGMPEDFAKEAEKLNQYALAITDHGVVSGLLKHFEACKEKGIKPILGCECYFTLDQTKKIKNNYHMTILAKSDTGYSNLMKLMTDANTNGFYYRPKIDVKTLLKYKEDLIVLSGCQASIFYQYAVCLDKKKKAIELLKLFQKNFKDFYLEIQPHTEGIQRKANSFAFEVNESLGIPLVLTIDSHMPNESYYKAQYVLRKVKMENASLEQYHRMWLHNRKTAEDWWYENYAYDCEEALNNTVKIAKMCNVELKFGNLLDLKWDEDRTKKLRRLAIKGMKDLGLDKKKKYMDRLKEELKVVEYHGFEDVFLATDDVVTWANDNGIQTGPGRGSAAGSLLSYCLGISKVDPVKYNLLFERFLRMDKKKMPDIDVDFDSRFRDKVFEYLNKRHEGNCAQVMNYGKYMTKILFNDIVKVFNRKVERISPQEKNKCISLIQEELDKNNDLMQNKILRKKPYVRVFNKLYKNVRYYGTHASGVAICKNMNNYVALVRKGKDFVTCYDLEDLEKLGILKMDILGLKTISIIAMVEEITGTEWTDKCLVNPIVFSRYASLQDLDGMFQFNSRTARQVLEEVRPENLEELTACSALNRPAPLKLGVVQDFKEAKNGLIDENKIWYKHSKDTYGCLIYQEQVMQAVRSIAGFSWDMADKTIKNLGTDDKHYSMVRKEFIKGAMKTSKMSKHEAEDLHNQMVRYLFNRSHALAYTFLSCYQMYQLVKYPLESLWAILINEHNEENRRKYESSITRKGIVILLAHVNGPSNYKIIKLDGQKVIQQGLAQIKGVGLGTAKEISENGPYKSLKQMQEKIPKRILRKNVLEALENYGALIFKKGIWIERCIEYNSTLVNEY